MNILNCFRWISSPKATAARLLEEQKGLLERLKELERSRSRPEPRPSAPLAAEPQLDAEEDDPLLTADAEALSFGEAKDFVQRLAARRDAVRLMRRSLCGALRQLGERLYTSQARRGVVG